jgi:integrase/recombinase XerC
MNSTTLLETFTNHLESQDRSPLTVRGYLADLRSFIRWFEQANNEDFMIQAVTPTDIRQYRDHLLDEAQRKASTINRHLAALSVFMGWAEKNGQIESDPTQDVRNIPQVNSGPKYLNKKQQFALQRAIEKDLQLSRLRYPKRWRSRQRDASLVTFLLHTGLRLQEALDLRRNDVEIGERKGQVLVRQGKGRKQRTVPLNAEARKAVQDWLAVRPDVNGDHLWVAVEDDADGALSGRSVQRVLTRLGQNAGLDSLTPHQLRHTFGKNLVDSGVGLEKVAALLGHANLNTTRIYITPNQQDLEQAVDRLARQY